MLCQPRVYAWDLLDWPDSTRSDIERYSVLLICSASTFLQPFGLDESALLKQIFYPRLHHSGLVKALRLFGKVI